MRVVFAKWISIKMISIAFSLFAGVSFIASCFKRNISDPIIPNPIDSSIYRIFYIDTAGNDNNSGLSQSKAWKSLSKVNNYAFKPGDKILFKASQTWVGQLNPKGSGTADSIIEIGKYGDANSKPFIKGPGSNKSAALLLNNQSYWSIHDLDLTNGDGVGGDTAVLYGIHITAGDTSAAAQQHIYIQNCYVHDVKSASATSSAYVKMSGGIIFEGGLEDILVKNCHIANCAITGVRTNSNYLRAKNVIDSNLIENIYGDGIVFHGAKDSSKITRNVVRNVCYATVANNYAGVWTYYSRKTLVAYNEVSGIVGGGVNDGQAFDADNDTDGDIFEYNYSHDNKKGFMLFMPSAQNIIVRYNMSIRDNGVGVGYQNRRLFNYTSSYNTNLIHNNVFYIDSTIDNVFQTGFIGEFSNNIVYANKSVTQFSAVAIDNGSSFYRNCFYPATITSVKGPAGTVVGNLSADSLFINATYKGTGRLGGVQNAFAVSTTSPCVTGGAYIPSSENLDYAGNNISNRTFIGAVMPPNAPIYTPTYNPYVIQVIRMLTRDIDVADTYSDITKPTINFGSDSSVYIKARGANTIGNVRNGFLRFPTSGIKTDSLNTSSYKVYIRVKVYTKENTATSLGLQLCQLSSNSWIENTLTYNNKPTLGSVIATTYNSGVVMNYKPSSGKGENVDFDITNYVKSYFTSNGNLPAQFNFGVQSVSSVSTGTTIGNSGLMFYSKEGGPDSIAPSIFTATLKDSTIYKLVK